MKRYYTIDFYAPEISTRKDGRIWVTVDRELQAERNKRTMSETRGLPYLSRAKARHQTAKYNRTLTAW